MSKLDYVVKRAEETAKNRAEYSTEHTDHTNYSDDYCAGFLGGQYCEKETEASCIIIYMMPLFFKRVGV